MGGGMLGVPLLALGSMIEVLNEVEIGMPITEVAPV
jgi:hypothetical protein